MRTDPIGWQTPQRCALLSRRTSHLRLAAISRIQNSATFPHFANQMLVRMRCVQFTHVHISWEGSIDLYTVSNSGLLNLHQHKISEQLKWCNKNYYFQVRANPPIRFAEWSGDKNLYCTANITTYALCVLCRAPSLLEDKYVITRALMKIRKIQCVCVSYPTRPRWIWDADSTRIVR